jgi:phosphatidylserine/phosphatidylglycerophosphate/cardiolipin synthase-like enzyme
MLNSSLHNESTFYHVFVEDLLHAKREVVIESPFITSGRMKRLSSIFQTLVDNNIKIYVVTRNPNEHPEPMNYQAEKEIRKFEEIGVQVLIYKKGHHRKLAVIDRKILWEGSLNILSQNDSREFMRRIDNKKITEQTFKFLNLERYF